MDDISNSTLFVTLILLVFVSAFFSAAETSLISLNRLRLRHLVRAKHPGAIRAARLLEKPDRFTGFILLGNNFANIAASVITTLMTQRQFGDYGLAIATGLLTFVLLVFGKVTPKTLAALRPERIAFPAAFIIEPLLRLFGVSVKRELGQMLTHEELRTILTEAGAMTPGRNQEMLAAVIDLDRVTVDDIMVPHPEIIGIDLDDDIENIIHQLNTAEHTRLPVFHSNINKVVGILHLRRVIQLLAHHALTKEGL